VVLVVKFLKTNQRFFIKIAVVNQDFFFIDVIHITIVPLLVKKKSLIYFKKFNKNDQIAYFL